jgi:hypothetical protein
VCGICGLNKLRLTEAARRLAEKERQHRGVSYFNKSFKEG